MIVKINDSLRGDICHMWPEKADFTCSRPQGVDSYTFYHFFGSVDILLSGKMVTTEPNACVMIPKNTEIFFKSKKQVLFDFMRFDDKTASNWLSCGLETEKLYYPHPAAFITELIKSIESEYIVQGPHFEKMIDSKCTELFVSISRCCNSYTSPIEKDTLEDFNRLRMKIAANLDKNWTVKDMADEVNISPSYFHALYKEIYGTSPVQDFINARVSSAKNMLLYSKDHISDIAKKLGYSNPYHFARQFRKATGESPSQFRSNNIK